MEGGTTAYHKMLAGEPDAGKPHVRFDEGEQWDGHQRHPLFSTLLGRSRFNHGFHGWPQI
jgi:hypothetical protein